MDIRQLKYKIIEKLDKNPDYCWANLVLWAEGYRKFWSLFFKNHFDNNYKNQSCREGNSGTPYAYCGKCEKTGKFYLPPNEE